MKKIIIVIFLFFAFFKSVYPQFIIEVGVPWERSDEVNIYNCVSKNILLYEIKQRYTWFSYPDKTYSLMDDYIYMLPDTGFYLRIDITKVDMKYPDANYTLYSIEKYGMDVTNGSISRMRPEREIFSKYFLVGYDSKSDKIKFISGKFFLSQELDKDFNLDIKNIESFEKYLEYRLYDMKPLSIKFYKQTRRKLFFVVKVSAILPNGNALVSIDKKNYYLVEFERFIDDD